MGTLLQIRHRMIRKLSCLAEGIYYVSSDELGAANYKRNDFHHFHKNPDDLQQKVRTLSDLILYVRTSFFRPQKGDIRVREGQILWHFNRTGPETICENQGNCGGVSSMLNFLLRDKYEEVGFIAFADKQGGHVFNYIRHEGYYYFVDLLNYLYASRTMEHYGTMIYQADSLQRYADYYRSRDEREITLMVAYEAEQVLPMGRYLGKPMMFFPKGSQLQVLHESPLEGIVVQHKPVYHCPLPLNNCLDATNSNGPAECEG